jgi:hypothetical protein
MSPNSDAPPLSVSLAIRCLWGSFAIDCISNVVSHFGPAPNIFQQMSERLNLSIAICYAMVFIAFFLRFLTVYFVMSKLLQGKNWARMLCLLIGIADLPMSLGANYRQLEPFLFLISIGLHMSYLLLGYYALYRLFSDPAKTWFRRKKAATA